MPSAAGHTRAAWLAAAGKKASQRASPAGLIRCPSGMAFESFAPPFSFSFSFRFDRQLRARARKIPRVHARRWLFLFDVVQAEKLPSSLHRTASSLFSFRGGPPRPEDGGEGGRLAG